jgi:hypothetical protein
VAQVSISQHSFGVTHFLLEQTCNVDMNAQNNDHTANYTMNCTQSQILLDDNVDVDAERDESMALFCLVSGEKGPGEEMEELSLTVNMTHHASSASVR